MPSSFNCPNCGAALEYSGGDRTMKCPYCGTSVQVPEELWEPVRQAHTVNQWKRYLILFLILTVGLPTCLGFLGAILGVGGTIFAAIVPFILKLFIH